jgi:hypothetical protein
VREAKLVERRSEDVIEDDHSRSGGDHDPLGGDRAVAGAGHLLVQTRDRTHDFLNEAQRRTRIEPHVPSGDRRQDVGQARTWHALRDDAEGRRLGETMNAVHACVTRVMEGGELPRRILQCAFERGD